MVDICKKCVNTLDERKGFCGPCYNFLNDKDHAKYTSTQFFQEEFDEFMRDRKKIIFAYSGGLDSTVVLNKVNKLCHQQGVDLFTMTVDYGFKGKKTLENIRKIIEFEQLEKNHHQINISQDKIENSTIFEYYKFFLKQGKLPCGPNCNKIMDGIYREFLKEQGEEILMTGGDTPKYNSLLGRFSIFWEQPGMTILRGGPSFGLTKNINRAYVKENSLPWEDPGCGGYDTDCLIPGAILMQKFPNKKSNHEEILNKIPVIIEYFAERVRWGIIERNDALEKISSIEVSDKQSFDEVMDLIK